jgi:hypothetical protein
MSEKFVVTGGLSIPQGEELEIGNVALSGINVTDYSSSGALATTDAAKQIIPSEYSVATYVNAQLGASNQLNFAADSNVNALNTEILLATESLSIFGTTNEIETSVSANNTIKIGLPNNVSITGTTSIGSTLAVTGESTLAGVVNLAAAGVATDIKGTLSVDEAATLDSTLAVTGVATFTEQSVHTGGIDCNGNLDMGTNAIQGNADEMIISADGDESSASSSATNSLSLNASGGIFTDDAVDMDSTLNVQSTVTMQANATVGTTLAVTGVGTFTEQSVHSAGIQTGGNIVSDTDSTDSLGTSVKRWASVHSDQVEMEYSSKKDFSVDMDGSDVEIANLTGFESGKIVLKVKNDAGTSITTKEILAVNGAFVEYATVSSGTELAMTIDVSGNSVTVNSAEGTATGSVDLIK